MIWSEMVGRALGPYEIVAELGRGGAARVYRARSRESGQYVAIKVIPNDADDPQLFVRRFQIEAKVVRTLNHPNIVKIYDAGQTEEVVYLVMQCVEGGTLRQRISQGALERPEAVAYAIQMAHALHHAHQHGVVHRDVKPSNMLLEAHDPTHLLLADFGIAKIQGLRGITKSGIVMGTPEYMSPEQAEDRESDPRSDIYSLGCVVYELLSGRPPFTGAHASSVLYQHVHATPAYIRGYNPSVPKSLCRVVETALAKNPDARFPTAKHFARALAPFAEPGYEGVASEPLTHATLRPRAPMTGAPAPTGATAHDLPTLPQGAARVRQAAAMPSATSDAPSATKARGPWPLLLGEDAPIDAAVEQTVKLSAAPAPGPTAGVDAALPAAGDVLTASDGGPALILRASAPEHTVGETPATNAGAGAPRSRVRTDPLKGLSLPQRPLDESPLEPAVGRGTARPRSTTRPAVPPMPATSTAAIAMLTRGTQGPVPAPEESAQWPKTLAETAAPLRKPRRRGIGIALAVVAVLALALSGSLVASATGLVTLPTPGARVTPPAQSATAAATATATTLPLPTATTLAPTSAPNQQQVADQRAYDSFRAVTLGAGRDSTCSAASARGTFVSGQAMYINLCASATPAAAPSPCSSGRQGRRCARLVRYKLTPITTATPATHSIPAATTCS